MKNVLLITDTAPQDKSGGGTNGNMHCRMINAIENLNVCAILNLILNYIFIKLCGYQAAAYTTFVCYAIFCLIHYYFYKKVCKEVLNGQRLYDGKGILWISIGVTIVGIAVALINHFLWLKYSIIIAILILLIVKKNTVINIVKDMIGKGK